MYVEHGLYIVKDGYFKKFPNDAWVQNKDQNRPYYYALRDSDDILWMVPMTTQVEKCRAKIERVESERGKGNCIYYHIGVIAGKERGFKIGDMFPITDRYILRPYTINKTPYIVKTKDLNAELYSKAMRFINLVQAGKIRDDLGVVAIKEALLNQK